MRDALPPNAAGHARHGFTCQSCGQLVVTDVEGLFSNPERGSTQRFCTPACRQAAYRRHAGTAENDPRQHTGGRNRRLANNPK